MEPSSNIKRTVMRRVHIIHAVRPFTSSAAVAAAVFTLALLGIGDQVFVAKVIENMPAVTDVAAVTRFFVAAFVHTSVAVQLLLSVSLVAVVWFVRDAGRAIQSSHRFA